jgi:cobalt/nickel transport system permease protein
MSLNPEHLSPSDSLLARRDARWRLSAFVLAIIAVAILRHPLTVAIALAFSLVLAWLGRVPGMWYRARIGVLLIAIIPFILITPFTVDRGERLWDWHGLSITDDGIVVALTLAAKTIALVTMALTLLATAPMHVTLAAAGRIGVPRVFVLITLLTYRYVFLFLDELNRLRVALRVRGFRNAMSVHAYRTVGQVSGTLLVRGSDRADHVAQAMRCRGFDGDFHTLTPFRTTRGDVLIFTLIVGVAGGLTVWDFLG